MAGSNIFWKKSRGITVDHDFFQNILLPAIQRQRIWHPLILHDNAMPHIHSKVVVSMSRHRWEQLEHLPYWPNLNPCDFDGIIRIKRPFKSNRYSDEWELITAVDGVIKLTNIYEEIRSILRLADR